MNSKTKALKRSKEESSHRKEIRRGVADLQRIGRNIKRNPRTFIKGTNISMGDSHDYRK